VTHYFETRKVWEGKDEKPYASTVAAELEWVEASTPYYQLSFTKGPFSGEPVMDLSRDQLEMLWLKIGNELYSGTEDNCGCGAQAMLDDVGDQDPPHVCSYLGRHDGHHMCNCGKKWIYDKTDEGRPKEVE
jgi:hypothetical protein